MTIAQRQVAELIEQRGYRDPYTIGQFAARQMAKLAEELAEMAECIDLPAPLLAALRASGKIGKHYFDDVEVWDTNTTGAHYSLASELADLQVVVFCLADALDELIGGYDVIERAITKAEGDVERGVR